MVHWAQQPSIVGVRMSCRIFLSSPAATCLIQISKNECSAGTGKWLRLARLSSPTDHSGHGKAAFG
jgi:hypothetical protein